MAVITLLSDFGYRDSYVAEMKAVLVTAIPAVQMIDISHDVPAGDIRAAQYLLGRSWRIFPPGTVHLVVVDPGVGTGRRALAVEREGHRFVAPDNGVLTPVLDGALTVSLTVAPEASRTFHGRDVFAPAAARLVGETSLVSLGPEIGDPLRIALPEPRRAGTTVTGVVVYVDQFGNLITNIPGAWVNAAQRVRVGSVGIPLLKTFGDVASGGLVAFVGSGNTVEVAVRDHSAAARLGGGVGTEVRLAD
jgi:hypothetical protein